MKKINVEEATELELIFSDGKKRRAIFNMRSVAIFQTEASGKEKIGADEVCEIIVFAAIKAAEQDFTREEAKWITERASPEVVTEIVNEFTESMTANLNNEQEQMIKKEMARLYKKMEK